MTLWAFRSNISHAFLRTIRTLVALKTVWLEYSQLFGVISAGRTRVFVFLVYNHVSYWWTPISSRTRIRFTNSPFADIAWLAATAVCNLTLSICNTHRFKRTRHASSDTTITVLAFWTFVTRWIRVRVRSTIACETCSALTSNLPASAIIASCAIAALLAS